MSADLQTLGALLVGALGAGYAVGFLLYVFRRLTDAL